MHSTAPTLLLTGATGLVGGELIPLLLSTGPDRHLALLTRHRHRLAHLTGPFVSIIEGDLRLPAFGLQPAEIERLRSSTTEIIHCAADTRFDQSIDDARAANVATTERVLEFARRCPRLAKLAHVSTVYVAGRATGRFAEAYARHDRGYVNNYQQSKHEAEESVAAAMDDLPIAIYRLSSLIGDASRGCVSQFNYIHQLIRMMPRNVLPVIPGDPHAPVDLIPSDWAIGALAILFEDAFAAGAVHQICAGPGRTLAVREVIDRTCAGFERHEKARRWLPLRVPDLVPLDEYNRFIEQRSKRNDALFRELVRVLNLMLPHLALPQTFETAATRAALDARGWALPPMAAVYDNVIAYCIDTDWGQTSRPSLRSGDAAIVG